MSDCPACGERCRTGSSFIAFCDGCGHRWLNRTAGEHVAVAAATFGQDYSGYRPDSRYIDTVCRFIRDEIMQRRPAPTRVLDVGCGGGDFMAVAQRLGYQVEGIDISDASTEICSSRSLKSVTGDLLTHEFGHDFGVIMMWDVLAHLRDPASFVVRARELLGKGGVLFIKTPAFGDLSVRLANRWPRTAGALLSAPSHNQYFDRESLTALLSRTGFKSEWISRGNARSPAGGGSLKRRVARRLRNAVSRLSGDESLYVAARPTG